MSNLTQALADIGATDLDIFDTDSAEWLAFCQSNETLFERVQTTKPENAITHHLLGVLTKAHIESLSRVEAQRKSVQAMNQAIDQNIGNQHNSNFRYQEGEQLLLITHVWLYLQGYLGMDFSLANDHAEMTAAVLIAAQGGDQAIIRSHLMSSFYHGKSQTERKHQSHSIVLWFKSLFK